MRPETVFWSKLDSRFRAGLVKVLTARTPQMANTPEAEAAATIAAASVFTTKLPEQTNDLLRTGDKSDITLFVGSGNTMRVFLGHKLLLAMGSDYFTKIFYGDDAVTLPTLDFPDDDPKVFRTMMAFFYLNTLRYQYTNQVAKMIAMAEKYKAPNLKNICMHYLLVYACPDNACQMYDLGIQYNLPKLTMLALYIIVTQTEYLLNSPGFLRASLKSLAAIVKQESLSIHSDYSLLNAFINWAVEECLRKNLELNKDNLWQIVRPLLFHIRFLTLCPEDIKPSLERILPEIEVKLLMDRLSEETIPPHWCQIKKMRSMPFHDVYFARVSCLSFHPGVLVHYKSLTFFECQLISPERDLFLVGFRFVLLKAYNRPTSSSSNTIICSGSSTPKFQSVGIEAEPLETNLAASPPETSGEENEVKNDTPEVSPEDCEDESEGSSTITESPPSVKEINFQHVECDNNATLTPFQECDGEAAVLTLHNISTVQSPYCNWPVHIRAENNGVCRVMFPTPRLLVKGEKYEIFLKLEKDPSKYVSCAILPELRLNSVHGDILQILSHGHQVNCYGAHFHDVLFWYKK